MTTRTPSRGMTLVEVLVAMAILSIAGLGLVGGVVVASQGTGIAAKRTEMATFARARIERLSATTRSKIPTSTTTLVDSARHCCTNMDTGTSPFDPNAAPDTGGWVMDLIDGTAPSGAGDDALFGPALVAGSSADTLAQTVAVRSAVAAAWSGAMDGAHGCADPLVAGSATQAGFPDASAIFCRELHIEPYNFADAGTAVPMLHVWVRVIQGGYNRGGTSPGAWTSSSVMMEGLVSQ